MFEFKKIRQLMFLQSAPQNLSCSTRLLLHWLLIYSISGIIIINNTLDSDDAISALFISLLVHAVFIYSVLFLLRYQTRFVQTFIAIVGVSTLFNLLTWLLLSLFSQHNFVDNLTNNVQSLLNSIYLILTLWEIGVKAFIFKHALVLSVFSAFALSLSLFFLTITISIYLLPALATQQ